MLTLLMAGTTALYPMVINHTFDMFTAHDRRILYQIPALVVAVTGVKALAQYAQSIRLRGGCYGSNGRPRSDTRR